MEWKDIRQPGHVVPTAALVHPNGIKPPRNRQPRPTRPAETISNIVVRQTDGTDWNEVGLWVLFWCVLIIGFVITVLSGLAAFLATVEDMPPGDRGGVYVAAGLMIHAIAIIARPLIVNAFATRPLYQSINEPSEEQE